MVLSETKSTRACKLCIVCINYFSQQVRWLRGRNKMCINEKKLRFLLSDYSFKRKESSRFVSFSKIFLTFQCDVGCIPQSVRSWHAKKDIIYA